MSEFIDVQVIGAKEAATKLNLLGARAEDMRPAFIAIRELLLEGMQRQYESKGEYLGTSWDPLTAATQERKSRMGQSSEILKATGALETALMGGSGKVGTVGKTFARAGVSGRIFWARFAQAGAEGSRGGQSSGRRGKEPARPIVGIGLAEGQEAVDILEAYLVSGVK